MNYVITLLSKKCDRFEIESLTDIEDIRDVAYSLVPVINHYNNKNNVRDFEIISIVKTEG